MSEFWLWRTRGPWHLDDWLLASDEAAADTDARNNCEVTIVWWLE